jgi:hypothetical protein
MKTRYIEIGRPGDLNTTAKVLEAFTAALDEGATTVLTIARRPAVTIAPADAEPASMTGVQFGSGNTQSNTFRS